MRACKHAVWAVALLTVGLNASPAADDEAKKELKKEMEKLAGVWAPVSVETGGQKAGGDDDVLKGIRYVFKADGTFRLEKDGEAQNEGTFTLDPSKKPKQVDYKIEKSISETMKGTTSLGIYELDGDTLKVCRTWPENDTRPTDFTAGPKFIVSEFKREKK